MKNAKIFNILRYIFGVFLLIGGLGNLSASVPFGLLITFAGIFIFPFVWKLLGKRMSFARWLPFLVPLLFFIAATPFVPASSVQSRTIVVTDETDTTDSSVTDTPEATPTETPTAAPNITKSPAEPTTTPTWLPILTTTPTETPVHTLSATPQAPSATDDGNTLNAPKQMTIKASADRSGSVRITWKNSADRDGFLLYRSTNKTGYKRIAMITARTTTYLDRKVSVGTKYRYKAVPYVLKNGQTVRGSASKVQTVSPRLMAPKYSLTKHKTVDGQRFLQIRLNKYQGKYVDVYIRKNVGRYVLLRLKNNNIKQQKGIFKLHYSFRNATISVKLRTYDKKPVSQRSFYSNEKTILIDE